MTVLLPAWLQAGSYNAEIDRSIAAGLLSAVGPTRNRPGVRRGDGDELQVKAKSPATMQVSVNAGMAWIQGAYTATQGVYCVVNDGTVDLTVAPSNSQPRIDIVVLEVLDSTYSGGSNLGRLRIQQGTASITPIPPFPGGSLIPLAQIYVGANVSSISSTAIKDVRPFTSGLGGIIPVQDAAARHGLLFVANGTVVYELNTGRYYSSIGGDLWYYIFGGIPPTVAITPQLGWYQWSSRRGSEYPDLRSTVVSNIVHVQGVIGNKSSFTLSQAFTLPETHRPEKVVNTFTPTGSGNLVRVDINPSGAVIMNPGSNGRTHPADDWWPINIHFFNNNNTLI